MQLTLNFVLFQLTHLQCALSQPQSHRNICARVFHASSKPIQVLLHPSSHQSTCLTHAVLFPQFMCQCRQAHLSSTPAPPSHQLHVLRALPAFPASILARNIRASLLFLLQSYSILFWFVFKLPHHHTRRYTTLRQYAVC
jgi:hypothetical protein